MVNLINNEKVNHFNCKRKKYISMGPSVKFVLTIIDSISKKMGVKFFPQNLTRRAGSEGFISDATKFNFFLIFPQVSNPYDSHALLSAAPKCNIDEEYYKNQSKFVRINCSSSAGEKIMNSKVIPIKHLIINTEVAILLFPYESLENKVKKMRIFWE